MVEKVSYRGGYVWSYVPDLSRRWGEMEAKKTMIWVQPPGTPTMGHLFLDAWHATGDEYYLQAAEQAADALIAGQLPCGGWNYVIDFAGEASLKDWYNTIGANGWRLEEFQHYYGNATFDDAGTAESAKFLLRLYVERHESKVKAALNKVIRFMLESQYPVGGWPQRYPPAGEFHKQGKPDYTSFITFNDDVAAENIDFLIMCYQTLGDKNLLDPINRAMNVFLKTQSPKPQAGWAMQYTLDLKPAGARTYEPAALSTSATVSNISELMKFYRLTGDPKYLDPIPAALDWLDAVALPAELVENGRTHPLFVELGTNKPLYIHRKGSNVVNGEYYVDYNPERTIAHYRSTRFIDVDTLRREYEATKKLSPQEATKDSPLKGETPVPLPPYFTIKVTKSSDLNSRDLPPLKFSEETVQNLVHELNPEGYWPAVLRTTTHPYIGSGPEAVTPGDYSTQFVGDDYDTSPYFVSDPVKGISVGVYIKNIGVLIEYLERLK